MTDTEIGKLLLKTSNDVGPCYEMRHTHDSVTGHEKYRITFRRETYL